MPKFIKKLLIISVAMTGSFVTFGMFAHAQTGQCDVVSAFHRTTRPIGPNFYSEESRPYVYIDIITQNCMGQSIEVSITESDTVQSNPDDDVNGNLGETDICNNNFSSCMDNRVINVNSNTTNNFTLALIAGEDECENIPNVLGQDCEYHLETYDDVDDFEWSQVLGYECDGICDDNWEYLGIIPYLSTHSNDGDAQNNNQQNGGANGYGNGSSTAPAVINLNIENPISSVNSIPEFFQDVVNIIIKIAIPFTAIVLVYCGLLFVTARGDSSQLEKARNAFTYAVIGGLVLLASWLIAQAIQDAITSLAYVL